MDGTLAMAEVLRASFHLSPEIQVTDLGKCIKGKTPLPWYDGALIQLTLLGREGGRGGEGRGGEGRGGEGPHLMSWFP